MKFSFLNRASKTTTTKSRKPASRTCQFESLEGRQLMSATIVVNTVLDKVDPASSATISLRDAVTRANASKVATTISFKPSVFNSHKTIVLTLGQLELKANSKATIAAPSYGVGVSGNYSHGAFLIDAKASTSFRDVTVFNCDVKAGITNNGVLGMTDSTVYANNAGGIYNGPGATAVILRDTISGNYTTGKGAGIYNYGGTVVMTNSTVAYNFADSWGGGIENTNGVLKLYNDTIAGNEGYNFGGGVDSTGTYTNIVDNTIIATNMCDGNGDGVDFYGHVTSNGRNLLSVIDSYSSGWTTDFGGTAASPFDAYLGGLENNGGPTLTMKPASYSAAIDNGNNYSIPAGVYTDQIGNARVVGGIVDIGAVEYQ